MKLRITAALAAVSMLLTVCAWATTPASSKLEQTFVAPKVYEAIQFDDVKTDDWFYYNVLNANRFGLMQGKGNKTFAPNDTLTVAEAVAMAARIHSTYTGNIIPTYARGEWYLGVVGYANTYGLPVIGGYNDLATRDYFCHIMASALPQEEFWSNGSSILFSDETQMTYTDDVYLLSRAGIINGIPQDGVLCFRPGATITRAEAAAIITRMIIPANRVGA